MQALNALPVRRRRLPQAGKCSLGLRDVRGFVFRPLPASTTVAALPGGLSQRRTLSGDGH
jgi:hypothetical protein